MHKLLCLLLFAMVGYAANAVALEIPPSQYIIFEPLRSEPRSEAKPTLQQVAKLLESDSQLSLTIEGFDAVRNDHRYFYILGRNRMLRTFYELAQLGIDASRLSFRSLGKHHVSEEQTATPETMVRLSFQRQQTNHASRRMEAAAPPAPLTAMTLTYAKGSEKPTAFAWQDASPFLAQILSCQQGHLRVLGYPGPRGQLKSPDYGMAMARLRVLSLSELLIREGFPATRMEIDVVTDDSRPTPPGSPSGAESDQRYVALQWVQEGPCQMLVAEQAPTAPEAQAVQAPSPDLSEELSPITEEAGVSATSEPQANEGSGRAWPRLSLSLFAGPSFPGEGLKEHVSQNVLYGLGLGGDLITEAAYTSRWSLAYARTSFKAKSHAISGGLDLSWFALSVRHGWHTELGFPYLHLGAGLWVWDGTATQLQTQRRNQELSKDPGLSLGGGISWQVLDCLDLGPEVLYHRVFGDFGGSLWTATVLMQWRF